jgi:hypothetical protein
MSLSAFLNGESVEQINHKKKEAARRELLEQQTKQLAETERVLAILRTIKPHPSELTPQHLQSWRASLTVNR